MKTKILPIVILSLLFGGVVLAQETELPDPGMTPDSPFYFLERITEAVGTFFTFGDLKKAERHAILAAERLAEAKAVAEKGKSELTEKTLQRYENQLNNSIARAEKAQAKGENTEEVMAKVGQATSKHLEVLAEVYEKVPEQAKPAIEQAMKVSIKGHEKAVEALKTQNALGEVPEEAPLPAEVPVEVRERIQMKVQQELEIEKALESIDTSKSLRDICIEKGGPSEICEQFPDKKFKSFKEIEDYCIGLGAQLGEQTDVCSTLEQKCREFGVTAPNECFLLLWTATITTSPAPSLSEEEMEERARIGEEIRTRESEQEPTETGKRLKQRYTPGVSKVVIYFLPTCPHCVEAKEWLNQHNIEYEAIDISESKAAGEELTTRTGGSDVPTIVMDNQVLIGFTEKLYSEFFGIE